MLKISCTKHLPTRWYIEDELTGQVWSRDRFVDSTPTLYRSEDDASADMQTIARHQLEESGRSKQILLVPILVEVYGDFSVDTVIEHLKDVYRLTMKPNCFGDVVPTIQWDQVQKVEKCELQG